jgi:hypothetical protein
MIIKLEQIMLGAVIIFVADPNLFFIIENYVNSTWIMFNKGILQWEVSLYR